MERPSKRKFDELRKIVIEPNFNKHAEGSCLIKCGDTHVICTATVEDKVPMWMRNSGRGWITAEYGMIPRATGTRTDREAKKGQSGRSEEIQRLIGRALRSVVDLKAMGEICIKIDCDVIQADGGTRTASITGGFVALHLALQKLRERRRFYTLPLFDTVSAISCGIYEGTPVLDLDYIEDSNAETDSNFVITGTGGIVEIQGTAERKPFSLDQFHELYALAVKGTTEIARIQHEAVGE